MNDLHHTYGSLHKEHHAWRLDLISVSNSLNELALKLEIADKIDERENLLEKINKHRIGVEERLKNLTQADMLMNEAKDKNQVISQKLFSINSKMRKDLIAFDLEFNSFKETVNNKV